MVYNNISSYIKRSGKIQFFKAFDEFIKNKYENVKSEIDETNESFTFKIVNKKMAIFELVLFGFGFYVFQAGTIWSNYPNNSMLVFMTWLSLFIGCICIYFSLRSYMFRLGMKGLKIRKDMTLTHKHRLLNEFNVILSGQIHDD